MAFQVYARRPRGRRGGQKQRSTCAFRKSTWQLFGALQAAGLISPRVGVRHLRQFVAGHLGAQEKSSF